MRRSRAVTLLIACLPLLLLLPATASLAVAEGPGPGVEDKLELKRPGESVADMLDLMSPMRDLISGPGWLIARGIDPTPLLKRSGTDVFLGRQSQVGVDNPLLQAAGGGAAGLVPYRDPSPKFSRNILVSRDFSRSPFQTEPHLAVDPKDPDHLVLGLIDYNFPTITSYVSFDGGVTWEGPNQVRYPREHRISAGDPVVAFDPQGNPYFASISLDVEEFTLGPVFGEAVVSYIQVVRSEDGGRSWGVPIVTDRRARIETEVLPGGTPEQPRGRISFDFLDKPWFAIGPHPEDPGKGVLYTTYTKFTVSYLLGWVGELPFLTSPVVETVIELVRSEDGGSTWRDPIEVSPRVRRAFGETSQEGEGVPRTTPAEQEAEGTRRTVQGSQPVVAPDGTVYVAWMDSTDDDAFEGLAEIYVARSDDAGQTFAQPRRVAIALELPFRPRTAFFRYWGSAFPQVAVGPQDQVYVVYTAIPSRNPEDDGDVFLVRSLDRGETWERPQRINDDATGRLQFFPAIDVGPDGQVHVMWGDMRDDPIETRYHIYYSASGDEGGTWLPNSRVTDAPSNPNYGFPNGLFIGDYFSLKATEEDVYMVWADTRLGEFGTLDQKIGFARQRLMPQPELFISPPQGPGGQDVTIQGFSFQPNQNVFIEVAGSIVSTARTNAEGRLTSRLFFPIAGPGAHDVRVLDASGNVATGSFFMDFGFGDIQKIAEQLEALPERLVVPESQATGNPLPVPKKEEAGGTTSGNNPLTWVVIIVALAGVVLLSGLGFLVTWRLARARPPTGT